MRSSLVHALVVGCTIVGFSGCYSGGGWHMPSVGMFGWGKTDPDPLEYADSAPPYHPPGSNTAGSSGLPAPGASPNSFGSRPASYSGPISGRYPSTGSGAVARQPAGPYGSYAERGRKSGRDAYSSGSRYSTTSPRSKPLGAYGSGAISSSNRGFEGKNPYTSSSPSGSSSSDGYGGSAAPRYGNRQTNGGDGYRTAGMDMRGSGSRNSASTNTASSNSAPRVGGSRYSTTAPRSNGNDSGHGSGSRTTPSAAPRRSAPDEGGDSYRGGRSAPDREPRRGPSDPYVSGANVDGYRMGTNNTIPGNTGYTPPRERGDIVSGDSYSGGRSNGYPSSGRDSSYGTGRSSASVPSEYRPGGTSSYSSATGTSAPSYGAGTASPYVDQDRQTPNDGSGHSHYSGGESRYD